jgi:hypothetical protein
MSELTVIVISSDNREYLEGCLRALYQSNGVNGPDLIVVDNDSRDGSSEFVESRYPRAKIIKNSEKFGFARNNNLGIKSAKTDYILLLNVDTEVESGAVEAALEFLKAGSGAGVVGSKLYNKAGELEYSCKMFPSLLNIFLELSMLERVFPKSGFFARRFMGSYDHEAPRAVDWICGAFMMFKKETLEKVGLLDEKFFMFYEDADWCFRAKEAGYKVYYEPRSGVMHVKGGSFKGFSPWAYKENFRSLLYFYEKHYGAFRKFLLKVMLFPAMLLRILAFTPVCAISSKRPECAKRICAYAGVMGLIFKV